MLSSTSAFNFHVLLEQTATGQIVASIAELANFQVKANTRSEALKAIQTLVRDRLSQAEVVPLAVSLEERVRENPWTEFIGLFADDAEFAEIAAQCQADRSQESDETI